MSKYNSGDKFVIEVETAFGLMGGDPLYTIKGFNALVFDGYGLDKLQKLEDTDFLEGLKTGLTGLSCKSKEAYEKGLADAWELARKVSHMCLDDMNKCFDLEDLDKYGADKMLYEHFTPQEALAKIEAYEESKAIKVGDVVIPCNYSNNPREVWVLDITPNGYYKGIWLDTFKPTDAFNMVKKTGRHIDISSILEQIGGMSSGNETIYSRQRR